MAMRTRREQVQAHRFVTRRIVSAMLSGEPETNDLPMRRLGQALFASVMIGTLVLAAVGVIGIATGRGSGLALNTLVVEKETGARFVYLGGDPATGDTTPAALYPVANYASARLILGVAAPTQRTMSHASLQDIPRGPMLGIPNAPDALPPASSLLGTDWSVCNLPATAVTSMSSRAVVGTPITGGTQVRDDFSLLVTTSSTPYLIYRNEKLKVTDDFTPLALGLDAQPIRVTQQFLNAIPSGPNLAVISLGTSAGTVASQRPDGRTAYVGWVFQDPETRQYYLMAPVGLVVIGEVYAKLRLTRDNGTVHPISTREAARLLKEDNNNNRHFEPPGYPLTMPALLNDATGGPVVLCAQYRQSAPGDGDVVTSVYSSMPLVLQRAATSVGQNGLDVVSAVNQVVIAGGHGALVQPTPAPGASARGSTVYLVTDSGIKYPLSGAPQNGAPDAATALGYGGISPIQIPLSMLDLLPTGVSLDGNAARKPIQTSNPKPSTSRPQPSPSTSSTSSPSPSPGT